MRSCMRSTLGLLVVLIAWCHAESFAVNSAGLANMRTRIRHTEHRQPIVASRPVFTRIRGGDLRSSATSFFESIPKSGYATSLATILHSFVDPAITGGFLSGGLHAVTGPDHLAALIAPTVGKSGLHGMKVGALWGVGHGFTAILLGLCVYFLKGQFTGRFAVMEKLSTLAESVVGVSILFIGVMGIKESWEADTDASDTNSTHSHHHHDHAHCTHPHDHVNADTTSSIANVAQVIIAADASTSPSTSPISTTKSSKKKPTKTLRAVLANGMLHGFSWDGAPSLAPAVTMPTWQGALSFLAAYSLGTIVAMSLAAGVVGELSTRVGKASDNPDLPRKLSFVSSMAAVAIGVYLTTKSVLKR